MGEPINDALRGVILPLDREGLQTANDILKFLGDDFHVTGQRLNIHAPLRVPRCRVCRSGTDAASRKRLPILVSPQQALQLFAVWETVRTIRENNDAVLVHLKQFVESLNGALAITERRVGFFDLLAFLP